MKSLQSIQSEYILKIIDCLLSTTYNEREKIEFQKLSNSKKNIEVIDIEIFLKSNYLFSISKKIYPLFSGNLLEFISHLFSVLDQVKKLDKIPSITAKKELSVYNKTFKNNESVKNSYAVLSKIPLLKHIEDIIDLILIDYSENALELAQAQFFILLSLLHDLGKILNLMTIYGIQRGDGTHEERGYVFFKMLLNGFEVSKDSELFFEKLEIALKKMSLNANGDNNLKKFNDYDERSRIIEIAQIKGNNK